MGERGEGALPGNIERVLDAYGEECRLEAEDHVRGLRVLMSACESPAEQLFLARFAAMYRLETWCLTKREHWPEGPYDLEDPMSLSFHHPHLHWSWGKTSSVGEGTDRLQLEIFVQVPIALVSDANRPLPFSREEAEKTHYRLDFLLVVRPDLFKWPHGDDPHHSLVPPAYLAVEVDGHDYHERTKEQAARDRQRDRDLQSIGVPTMRFTASEVYHDEQGMLPYQAWKAVWNRAVELGLPRFTERRVDK